MKYLQLFLVCTLSASAAFSVDYRQIFGTNYIAAIRYIRDNRDTLESGFRRYKSDPDVLIPVIFPELIRYSLLRDKMETAGLRVFYIKLGKDYANFSIGRFQIKPSFIEKMEKAIVHYNFKHRWMKSIVSYPHNGAQDIRRERVKRLESIDWQIKYLACFYHIIMKKHEAALKNMKAMERIKFIATAYNRGFDKTFKDIRKWENRRYFPYGKTGLHHFTRGQYCYSSISIYFYTHDWADRAR